MAKVLVPKGVKRALKARPTKGFDNPATSVGQSKWLGSDGKPVMVYYDPASQGGLALATDILQNRIDDLMAFCDDACQVKGGSGNVLIVPGNSGAYHYGCDFVSGGDWYEDDMGLTAPTTNNNGGLVTGLVMAEVIESYMGLQNKGWNCGGSGGEALSRIFAETASGGIAGAMSGGFSARSSYDGSNWIDQDQGSDQDYPSIGCGMLYLDWMRALGYSLQEITRAGESAGTLASNYKYLTGKDTAWADFAKAVGQVDINATNPFNIKDTPYPLGGGGTPSPNPGGALQQWWDNTLTRLALQHPYLSKVILWVKDFGDQWFFQNPQPTVKTISRSVLQTIVDAIFAAMESAETGHPIIEAVLTTVQYLVDQEIIALGW